MYILYISILKSIALQLVQVIKAGHLEAEYLLRTLLRAMIQNGAICLPLSQKNVACVGLVHLVTHKQ